MEHFLLGITPLADWHILLFIVIGVALGIICGAMPGLSGTTGVALMIPITYNMEALPSVALLVSLYMASEYGGSITAITLNIPGAPAAVMSTLDGFPMTQQGKTGRALAISIFSSTFGGIFSTIILILFAPPLANVALAFSPVEFFSLGLFGLSIVASLAGKSWLKAIIAALIGLLIKTIGSDPLSGTLRFTFGWSGLYDGAAFVPLMLGLFAVSEVFQMVEAGAKSLLSKGATFSKERAKWSELFRLWKCLLRSSIIGTIVGIVPGVGAGIGSIISYNEARRWSKTPAEFGNGAAEGLCASETANNSTVGGAMVPLLTLGIPGSGATAVLIGALMLHNVAPGPLLFVKRPDVVYGIFSCLFLANFVMFAMGLIGVGFWLRVVRVSPAILAPLIFGISVIGAYGIGATHGDILIMIVIGVIAHILKKFQFPLLPMVIALVLGYMIEISLRRALLLSNGDATIFFTKPLSVVFIILAIGSVVFAVTRDVRTSRRQKDRA